MHFTTTATLALAASGTSLAKPLNFTSQIFGLTAFGSQLDGWAVVNAHVGAGQDAVIIQRPSAYTPDKAVLTGTAGSIKSGFEVLNFHPNQPISMIIPSSPDGVLSQVFSEYGDASAVFSVNAQNELVVAAAGTTFFACPTEVGGLGKVFGLFFGTEVPPKVIKNKACKPISLRATVV
ncbi:uncharacterized protein LTR77_010138 [Saxophila tyrrhenica]|uniref:DUF7907 domain-containing protein n=1 Tax=Saxophila tyrrhenica TaxID=1690608 RepID=A0AAV9NW24_9PEZI|nr:hypothetical protein LTR77_010138 [Saxophila tyrrhenica]